jgi:hypothetical protein
MKNDILLKYRMLNAEEVNREMSDTYVIDVQDPGNALDALMFVLAIDAKKCSRN